MRMTTTTTSMTMAEVKYPYGYANPPAMLTLDEIFAKAPVAMLHSEYKKRFKGLMVAGGGRFSIGGAGRTTKQQETVFLQRHHEVKSGGCCGYNGKRYQLNTGMAHAAPPGRSFHEPLVQGAASAVDAIGDLKWAALNCEAYGLEQATWGGEIWHFQFSEFPHSVAQWQKSGSPAPQNWKLPTSGGGGGSPTPPVQPNTYTVKSGDSWYGIASKVGCTPEALVAANPPATMSTVIHPGDVLKLPSGVAPPASTDWKAYGAAAKTPPGNPQLVLGVIHPNAQEVQAILCSMPKPAADGGAPCYPPEKVDKDTVKGGPPTDNLWGDQSVADLKWWQGKNGLTSDGQFGPKTSSKMTSVRGK
jgi:LysM repeat protein